METSQDKARNLDTLKLLEEITVSYNKPVHICFDTLLYLRFSMIGWHRKAGETRPQTKGER